jgi:hypothetical protein
MSRTHSSLPVPCRWVTSAALSYRCNQVRPRFHSWESSCLQAQHYTVRRRGSSLSCHLPRSYQVCQLLPSSESADDSNKPVKAPASQSSVRTSDVVASVSGPPKPPCPFDHSTGAAVLKRGNRLLTNSGSHQIPLCLEGSSRSSNSEAEPASPPCP